MKTAIVAIAAVLAWGGVCHGRTITADDDGPADFNNIQAAIDDSNDGDTVLIADGRYTGAGNRDIDFHGKAITVKSQNGPGNCIIDCNGSEAEPHRGFYFHSGEGLDSVLSGVTVTNGYAREGGGILCDRAGPAIEDCIITRNAAERAGGGIYYDIWSSHSAALSRCVIAGNRALGGGGIWFETASGMLKNCLIVGNTAVYYGGGVGIGLGIPLRFEACTFAGNSAEFWGGAVVRCRIGSGA